MTKSQLQVTADECNEAQTELEAAKAAFNIASARANKAVDEANEAHAKLEAAYSKVRSKKETMRAILDQSQA